MPSPFSLGAGVAAGVRQSEEGRNSPPPVPRPLHLMETGPVGLSCHPELITRFSGARAVCSEASGVVGDVLVGEEALEERLESALGSGISSSIDQPIDVLELLYLQGAGGCRTGISSVWLRSQG